MSKSAVFLRDATGLVREFSALDMFILGTGSVIGPASLLTLSTIWFWYPSANIPLSYLITLVISLINGLYYVMMSCAMPRSGGGGYVPLSRVVHPVLGIGASYLMILALVAGGGIFPLLMLSVGIAGPLGTYATITKNTQLQSIASALTTPYWGLIIGTIFLVVVGIILISGTNNVKIVNRIMMILGVGGFLAILTVLALTPQAQFQLAFENFAGQGAYQNVISTAHGLGFGIPSDWMMPTILSLPLTFSALIGFQLLSWWSGEVKRVRRSVAVGMLGGVTYAACIEAALGFVAVRTYGSEFITSISYLFNAQPGSYPLSVAPWINTLVIMINSNILLVGIVIACWIAAGYYGIMASTYLAMSRMFLAWSFDRAVPSIIGSVSDRFHSPVLAIAISLVASWVCLVFYSYLPSVMMFLSLTFFLLAGFTLDGLAGVFMIRKKQYLEMVARSAPLGGVRIGGIPLVSILGAFSVIAFSALIVVCLQNPALAGPLSLSTVIGIVGTFLFGVVVYYAMRAYHARHGLDISMAFKEIPPE